MQLLRRGSAAPLHARRRRRAAPRAGGCGGPARPPLALPLHGGGRGPSGGHDHGRARPPAEAPPALARAPRCRQPPGEPGKRRPRRRRRRRRAHRACPTPPAAAAGPAPQPRLQRLLPPLPGARRADGASAPELLPGESARPPRPWMLLPDAGAQRAAAPGDPRRAVPWRFIHKKSPQPSSGPADRVPSLAGPE